MEKWRRVFRDGLAPQLSTAGLQALATALVTDDPRLLQGSTCYPPLLDALRDRDVEGACLIGFCAWQAEGCGQVGKLEEYFQRVTDTCNAICDANMDEVATSRYLLNWYDDTARDEMRLELLGEVQLALKERTRAAS